MRVSCQAARRRTGRESLPAGIFPPVNYGPQHRTADVSGILLKLVPLTLLGIVALVGCAGTWKTTRAETPSDHQIVCGQLVVHSDFPLPAKHRMLEDLTAGREDVSRRLGLPPDGEPIHIYLFKDAERFEQYMRMYYPQFPMRRAFFVQTDTRLEVYAHWGDHLAEDLRHEVTHGYLHSLVPDLPLWLDEGLAEYFEVSRGHRGLNRAHLDNLVARLEAASWRPSVKRLEQLDRPFDMTLDDYAESWAWVHFLLESHPRHRQMLGAYLAELRQFGSASPMAVRLAEAVDRPEDALVEHVRRLAVGARETRSQGSAHPQ